MSTLLLLESSTTVCSVAVCREEEILFNRENHEGLQHATLLAPYAQEAIEWIRQQRLELSGVAVSCGPGSYTGLRIGVSLAKGICYGSTLPLIAVNTLDLLAYTVLREEPHTAVCPMIDARRMEVYAAIYAPTMELLKPISSDIITPESYAELLDSRPILFCGNGAEKCRSTLSHPNAHFKQEIVPLARHMAKIATDKLHRGETEDVAYFEPFYLKEFMTTTPKNFPAS